MLVQMFAVSFDFRSLQQLSRLIYDEKLLTKICDVDTIRDCLDWEKNCNSQKKEPVGFHLSDGDRNKIKIYMEVV